MKHLILISSMALFLLATENIFAQSTLGKEATNAENQTAEAAASKQHLAYGIHKGNGIFSVQVGLSNPVSTIDSISGISMDEDWGSTGTSYGGQYLYAIDDSFLLGFEINTIHFSSKKIESVKIKVEEVSYVLASRIYANPTEKIRAYFPIGLGRSEIKGKTNIGTFKDSSFSYYAGIGLEGDLSNNIILGAEFRFTHAKFSKYDIRATIDYLSVLARLGYKF